MKPVYRILCSAALTAAIAFPGARAATLGDGVQQALQAGGEASLLVHFQGQVDLANFPGRGQGRGVQLAALLQALRAQAEDSQATAAALLRNRGARRLVELWSINALAVTADAATINALAALPEVERIELDATVAAPAPQPAALGNPEWNLTMIKAPELWNAGFDGAGTVVANMDTGVDLNHPDLNGNWRGGANSWFDPNGEHATPYDASGHGTQTMSLIAGGDAGGSNIGVAPGSQWIAAKIFNDAGLASLSGIHQGFQWMLDPDGNAGTDDAPDVVNNSWGFPNLAGQCYTEFETDIAVLKAAGIAVVFSAGNQGTLGSESPANNVNGFAAGAVDANTNLMSASSRGPSDCDGSFYPDLVAPGVEVRAADLTFGGVIPNSYASVTGTSYAAPHLSGAIALLRQSNPNASIADIEQALTNSALDLGAAGPDNDYGHGLVDSAAASNLLAGSSGPTCTDIDADGFFAEAGCGTAIDCNDLDGSINPLACDIKGDGIDQDCDGKDRTRGKSCPSSGGGGGGGGGDTGLLEGKGKTCADGIDNDLDGRTDCADTDCFSNKSCR